MSEPAKPPTLLGDAIRAELAAIVKEAVGEAMKAAKPVKQLLFTTKETAAILNVEESWLGAKARAKTIPHRQLGHYRYFSQTDIDEIIASACVPVVHIEHDEQKFQADAQGAQDEPSGACEGLGRDGDGGGAVGEGGATNIGAGGVSDETPARKKITGGKNVGTQDKTRIHGKCASACRVAKSRKTFRNYRAAVSFDEKTKTQLRENNYVAPSVFTVREIMEKWLEARKPRWKAQTYLGHKTHVDKYIVARLGEIKATSLQAVDVERAGAEWEKSVSAKTVNKIFSTLSAAFKFARKLDVKHNPMADVERRVHRFTPEDMEADAVGAVADRGQDTPEGKAGALRAIQPDEVYSALELKKIIDRAVPGLEKALLMTAILTGVRHGELNALRWSVINLKTGKLFVNRSLTELKGGAVLEKPKTRNAYRYIKMAPELLSELRHWKLRCPPSPNDFVFVSELGRPMNRKANNRMLKACCERAGIRALNMNNLRHSFASQHLIADTDKLEVSKLMGHSTPDVTLKIYSRWTEREDSKAEVALAGRIFAASDPQEATGSELG